MIRIRDPDRIRIRVATLVRRALAEVCTVPVLLAFLYIIQPSPYKAALGLHVVYVSAILLKAEFTEQ